MPLLCIITCSFTAGNSPIPAALPNSHPFFFNDTATTEIYTLSLHDALPISRGEEDRSPGEVDRKPLGSLPVHFTDRKSTRLNSSHITISYAVFCLKKKKKKNKSRQRIYSRTDIEDTHEIKSLQYK